MAHARILLLASKLFLHVLPSSSSADLVSTHADLRAEEVLGVVDCMDMGSVSYSEVYASV